MGIQPTGPVTTSGTISVLRDERGGSCKEERSKLATAKIQKQNSGKLAG